MRIIAGQLRGRKIETLKGHEVRPTASRTREAVFNLLAHHRLLRERGLEGLEDCAVADVCCGSGAMGFEAASRGARHVTFVDMSTEVLKLVRQNAEAIGVAQHRTLQADATNLPPAPMLYDVILLDPPYHTGLAAKALASIARQQWLARHGVVVVETGQKEALPLPAEMEQLDQRRYGAAVVTLVGWREQESGEDS
jgi:16S rRNA (guanine966-N2)-methyltransferase